MFDLCGQVNHKKVLEAPLNLPEGETFDVQERRKTITIGRVLKSFPSGRI